MILFFFFKQKTAYEMRISDWSSDVCSSDLRQKCVARRISRPRPAPQVGEAIVVREEADAERRGDTKRTEMRDEQSLEAKPARKEQPGEHQPHHLFPHDPQPDFGAEDHARTQRRRRDLDQGPERQRPDEDANDRKSVVEGKRVSVRVDDGGARIIKKKK